MLMMKLMPHRAFRASALEMAVSKCHLVSVLFLSVFLPRLLTSMTEDLLQVFMFDTFEPEACVPLLKHHTE